jgi:hypothetical protein
MPPLKGYVITTAKSAPAMTLLQVPGDESEEGDVDPLLAIWQYGLGKGAAWTSDLSPNWAANWMDWDQYQPFVSQLMTDISRVRKEGHLRMWTYTDGGEGTIVVEDFSPEESFLEIQGRVSGPKDRAENIPLKQVGPRRYQASVPLWGKGRYHIVASPVGEHRKDDRAFGGFIVPYSPEYLRFRSNPIALNDIVEKTGGTMLSRESKADEIFQRDRQPKRSSLPIFRAADPDRLVCDQIVAGNRPQTRPLHRHDGRPARTQTGGRFGAGIAATGNAAARWRWRSPDETTGCTGAGRETANDFASSIDPEGARTGSDVDHRTALAVEEEATTE